MDAPALGGIKLSPVKGFEQLAELRAQRHEHLRGRNNVTSCRSPTKEIDTKQIKDQLKEKRHREFLKRRSLSCPSYFAETFSPKLHSQPSPVTIQESPAGKGRVMIVPQGSATDGPSNHRQVRQVRQEKGQSGAFTLISTQSVVSAQKTAIGMSVQGEKAQHRSSITDGNRVQRRVLRDVGVQTDSGLVNVRESDIQMLAEYLQEALWREEAVKRKLAVLQESTSNLVNSSNFVWKSRCSEDLLRNKIRSLEEQLQACLQKFPRDGVKKLALQLEKQKVLYEEKALVALQKATRDKAEAVGKAAALQEALITAQAEAVRWQNLHEEGKKSCEQLHAQAEMSRSTEAELRQEVALLQQEKQELQSNMSLMELDIQVLRDEIQQLTVEGESQDFIFLKCPPSEEKQPEEPERSGSLVEEQLRLTQKKLFMKETECEELQAELCAMEQECKSSQARLSQCRDELRQLSHRRRRPLLGSGCVAWVFSLLLLAVLQAAMLWLWYPPFRQQIEDLCTEAGERLENYLMDTASAKPCFKPI